MACVSLKIGPWEGKCKLLAMPLDDFDVILGIDFLLAAKCSVLPYLGGIFIANEKEPCFVKGITEKSDKGKAKGGLLSALQVEAGLKRGEVTYLAALVEIKPDQVVEVPKEGRWVLKNVCGLSGAE